MLLFRAIALSLALLFGLGAIAYISTEYTDAKVQKGNKSKKKKRQWRGVKKYSKRWWQLYHQQQKRRQSLAKRRRALRLRQIRLAKTNELTNVVDDASKSNKANRNVLAVATTPALLPTGEVAPKGWRPGQVSSSNELQFQVADDNGSQIGSASIAVVGPASNGVVPPASKNKTIGGVMTTALRGTVIDRMIKEEGWVVNDYQKEIGGKKVYVVVAQSPGAGGAIQSRMFYFTEVDGKIYSVATSAPTNSSERLVQESERVIDSLQRAKSNPQQAELK